MYISLPKLDLWLGVANQTKNLWIPKSAGNLATQFIDLTTEGSSTPHYWNNGTTYTNFSSWIAGVGGTFSRPDSTTCATYFNSSGLLATATANTPRIDYNPSTLAIRGYLNENSNTNIALWNRDFTNIAWAKTNVNASKNQTGIDGSANSASSLTSTLANGTCTQSVTTASVLRAQCCYVKRLVGTGTVLMTMDNFTTTTDITAAINSSTYTRVPTSPGLTQSVLNPIFGFKLVTSGDSIAVDYFTNEAILAAGFGASSPIATTTTAVTRAADRLTIPVGTWFSSTVGAGIMNATFPGFESGASRYIAESSFNIPITYDSGGSAIKSFDGVNNPSGPINLSNSALNKFGTSWSVANNHLICGSNGALGAASNAAGFSYTTMSIGSGDAPTNDTAYIWLRSFTFFNRTVSDADLTTLVT